MYIRSRKEKKALGETQTLRAGRTNAEPKTFAQLQTPFPGAPDGQNLISWRWSLPSPTDPVWWKSMHAISSYRGNRPTHKQHPPAHPPVANTQTGPITIHCAAKLSAQCNYGETSTLVSRIWGTCRGCRPPSRIDTSGSTTRQLHKRHQSDTVLQKHALAPNRDFRWERHPQEICILKNLFSRPII